MLQTLKRNIELAAASLQSAQAALERYEDKAENNIYTTLEDAEGAIEEILLLKAEDDCAGSYNCGDSLYDREFIADGLHYIARLEVEYNRHAKQYYYIDSSKFSVAEA